MNKNYIYNSSDNCNCRHCNYFFTIKSMNPTATVVVANQNLKVGTVISRSI